MRVGTCLGRLRVAMPKHRPPRTLWYEREHHQNRRGENCPQEYHAPPIQTTTAKANQRRNVSQHEAQIDGWVKEEDDDDE